jgi:hypothetical protein
MDNDSTGEAYIKSIHEVLFSLNPKLEFRLIELPGLPPKGDICDCLKQNNLSLGIGMSLLH